MKKPCKAKARKVVFSSYEGIREGYPAESYGLSIIQLLDIPRYCTRSSNYQKQKLKIRTRLAHTIWRGVVEGVKYKEDVNSDDTELQIDFYGA